MSRGLTQRIQSFHKVRVLVVGDLVADHYLFGQTERVSREAPVLIVRHEREDVKLGGAANAAANARALGAQVTALGVLGDDDMGSKVEKLFGALDIGLDVVSDASLTTETKTRILAGAVGTTAQQMLRIDRGAKGPLPAKIRKSLAKALKAALVQCDVAILSDYGAGVVCDETRDVLRTWGGRVCADSRYALMECDGLTVCKPNEPELGALTHLPVGTDAELEIAAAKAFDLLDCQVLLVTRGRRGIAVFERKGPATFLPVHGGTEAVDVTGAGDTVLASFAVALAAGSNATEAARIANVAGGLVVQKPGTAVVTQQELLDVLG